MQTKPQIGFGDWYCPKNLKNYLNEIIGSRRLTYGPFCEKLEKLFGEHNGTTLNNFCSSGTTALFTAIGTLKNIYADRAAKRKKIILPATTFISDFNCVKLNGFEPIFVDTTADYNMSLDGLEDCLKDNSADIFAVMPSSLFGRPINGKKVKELIDAYSPQAFFILDNCETISAKYDGTYPESHADFTAWSFYISHLLVGGACGGMLGTNNTKYSIQARSYINHGRQPEYISIDDDDNLESAKLKDITAKRFKFVQPGLNFRLGEVEAAFVLAMLEDDFAGQLKKREENALKIYKALSKFNLKLPTINQNEQNRWMMFPINVQAGNKWDLINHLEKNGIETRELLPLYQKTTESHFTDIDKFRNNFPESARAYDSGFYIGCHQYLQDADIDYIEAVFEKYFSNN